MSDSLVPSEGVDEGSAAGATESAAGRETAGHAAAGVLGPLPHGRPARESDPAPGEDLETAEAREAPWTGQQLAEGEG